MSTLSCLLRNSSDVTLPTLGVIGGMGPLATVDFLNKVILGTPARCDQEHLPIIACSIPQVPDRTTAILAGGPSPLPVLLYALAILQASRVDYIAIPCNTAHFWHADLQARSNVEVLHIVDAVIAELRWCGVSGGAVGLLATTATVKTGIYQQRLAAQGFHAVIPNDDEQRAVMSLIHGVKSGTVPQEPAVLNSLIDGLESAGAQATVLACTELPLLKPSARVKPVVDSTAALARLCIGHALRSAVTEAG